MAKPKTPTVAPSLTKLLPLLADQLVLETPGAIRKAAARSASPPWCCALVFDGSLPGACLPPDLAIVTVTEREATLRDHAKAGGRYVWSCLQYDGVGAAWFTNRALLRACAEVTEHLVNRDEAMAAVKLLAAVARRLNDLPRKSFGKVSDDFVVYAFDRNQPATALVERSLTARQRTDFQRRGLL